MPQITLDDIVLPPDLEWTDEYRWSPAQQVAQYTITGALVVQASGVQAGRPITLEAKGDGHVWVPRSLVDAMRAKLIVPGATMTLTLVDGRTFDVIARPQDGSPFEADQVDFRATADIDVRDLLPYTLTLRLMQV